MEWKGTREKFETTPPTAPCVAVLDASGVPGSGFTRGNNYWLGSASQCRSIGRPWPAARGNTSAHASTPFQLEFYVANFRHNSSLQDHVKLPNEDLILVGLCLPDSCPVPEVSRLLESLFTSARPFKFLTMYDMELRLEQVRSLKKDNFLMTQPSVIIVLSVLLVAILLMVVGTLYDTLIWQARLEEHEMNKITVAMSNKNGCVDIQIMKNSINGRCDSHNTRVAGHLKKIDLHSGQTTSQKKEDNSFKQSAWGRFLLCFSIYSNTLLILNTKLGQDSVRAIHGLRFLGMCWIVMVHTVFYMSDFTDYFEMLVRCCPRLTPAYMAVLAITTINMSWYSRTSIFHMTERADLVCPKYWWRNLLYINNLFSREEMCMSWSWYLSNDMQFFIIATFLLIMSSRYMSASVGVLATLLVSSTLATGIISFSHGHVPTLDQQLSMLHILYDPPWTRIGPYIVGMVTGYLVVKLNGCLPLNKCTVALAWIVGSTFNLAPLFGLYDRNISPFTAAIYVALSRTAWGIGLSWLIVACCTNNAGFINRILSFPGWVPLSRLTYCAYLLNPMLMKSVYLGRETAMHVDFLPLATLCLGHLAMCYYCAYIMSLTIETPTILLIKHFVEKRSGSVKLSRRGLCCLFREVKGSPTERGSSHCNLARSVPWRCKEDGE
uniref:Nose resistant-to-fluoxetine protein N-terminal domain-containing protein n=1 Tax=Timema monikensis TaxID=170555 RepID=A0A7R9HSS7_9NEOP|nr:unnamed protein product [Timema monikensis]